MKEITTIIPASPNDSAVTWVKPAPGEVLEPMDFNVIKIIAWEVTSFPESGKVYVFPITSFQDQDDHTKRVINPDGQINSVCGEYVEYSSFENLVAAEIHLSKVNAERHNNSKEKAND